MTYDDIVVAIVLGWFTLMIVLIRARAGRAPWRRGTGRPRLEILPAQDADDKGRPRIAPASTGSPSRGSAPERGAAPTPRESVR